MASNGRSGSLDVTQGVIWKQLALLAIPIMFQNLFQQAYLLVDAFVVGQFAGKEALGGIQATTALCDLALNFCFGVCAGCAVIAGQFFGAHDDARLSRAVHVSYALALVMGLAASIMGPFALEPLLVAMETPQELMGHALAYGRLYFATMVFWLLENIGAALLRAVGDSRSPSAIIAGACIVNAVLDVIFVGALGLEAFGAQLATSISVVLSALAMSYKMMRAQGPWRLEPKGVHLEGQLAKDMLLCGIPLGFQMAAFPLSNTLVQSAINDFGTDAVAAWGLTGRLTSVCWLFVDSIAVALTAFSAQNFGARNIARMRKGLRSALSGTFLGLSLIAVVICSQIRPLAMAFINDAAIAELCRTMTLLIVPFYIFYGFSEVVSGTIRGAGESVRPMAVTLVGTCLFRVVWVLCVVPAYPRLETVIVSYPISYVLTAAVFAAYYVFGHWLKHAEEHEAKVMGV